MGRVQPLAELVALGESRGHTTFEELLGAAVPLLGRLVESASANAQWIDPVGGDLLGVFADRIDLGFIEAYVLHYCKSDPMYPGSATRDGRGHRLSDYTTTRELLATDYHDDILRPQRVRHVLGIPAAMPSGQIFMIACHRPPGRPDFTDAEARLWQEGGREVARALASTAFQRDPRFRPDAESGVAIFDVTGQLIHADEGGASLFVRLTRARRGPLLASLVRAAASRSLRAPEEVATIEAGPRERIVLRLSVAGGLAASSCVVVSLSRERDPFDRARERAAELGLSPREVEVATLVSRGLTNHEIAGALGLRVVTVRDHLRHVFAKLDVASRTGLVSLLLGGGPVH